jgi:hypothetical protein
MALLASCGPQVCRAVHPAVARLLLEKISMQGSKGSEAETAGLKFRDSHAQAWTVYEFLRTHRGVTAPILIFESSSAFRCVRRYPANWRELNAKSLEELSWKT